MTGPRFVGLDLSLQSTGLAVICDGQAWAHRLRAGERRGHVRLDWLCNEILRYAVGADLLVVEGASYGSAQSAFDLGGGWWVVIHHLWRHGIRNRVVVQPSTLKVYATGSGATRGPSKVEKDHVLQAVRARYPQVPVAGYDQADALVLAAMGADRYGCALAPVPPTHRRALASVKDWPGLKTGRTP